MYPLAKAIYSLIGGLLLLTVSSVSQAVDLSRGAMLGNTCAACHGTDGNSPGSIPDLQGKSAEFIRQSLHDFRDGKRPSTVMGRHARAYTDEEIDLIAQYFSSLSKQ